MKAFRIWDEKRPLRKWQMQAVRCFYALNKKDFLAVGTPGSGKTEFALKLAYDHLADGKVERIVIIAPTEHLKIQWAESAARRGIDIDPNWTNAGGREASDYFGIAVTYQQVSYAPDLYDLNCHRKTFVIFDEIHHAGEGLDWGEKLRVAFGNAAYRLALSGTPFRNDNNPIPFVNYKDRRSVADFVYGYGDALIDGVCRPIYFPTVEGNVSWVRGSGERMDCSLLDTLPRIKTAERLRAALDADGDWLREVLREADNCLTNIRLEGHANAAGLVIAIDRYHARKIASLLKIITNEKAVIAISDEENSSRMIQSFAKTNNHQRWIVAVKMVSEGVDIPRLRVGVYATTVLSELFFRQAVGRLLRTIPGIEEQSATLYLPADDTLVSYALAIKEEREHYLPEIIKAEKPISMIPVAGVQLFSTTQINTIDFDNSSEQNLTEEDDDLSGQSEKTYPKMPDSEGSQDLSEFTNDASQPPNNPAGNVIQTMRRQFIVPLSSEAVPHDIVFDGSRFSNQELVQAESIGRKLGVKLPPAQLAAIIKRASEVPSGTAEDTADNNSKQSDTGIIFNNLTANEMKIREKKTRSQFLLKSERKDNLRKKINRLANRLAHFTGSEHDAVHRRWIQEMNGKPNRMATEQELEEKLQWLENEIAEQYRTKRN
ncbi:hypothetical protein BH20ACI4_BH20ACI4_20770 [soil metagenome]